MALNEPSTPSDHELGESSNVSSSMHTGDCILTELQELKTTLDKLKARVATLNNRLDATGAKQDRLESGLYVLGCIMNTTDHSFKVMPGQLWAVEELKEEGQKIKCSNHRLDGASKSS